MERNASFITMVSTGEQPDAEIHAAMFHGEEAANAICRQLGNGRDLALLGVTLTKNLIVSLQEKDSPMAAAAFTMMALEAIHEASNKETMKLTNDFIDELGKIFGGDGE